MFLFLKYRFIGEPSFFTWDSVFQIKETMKKSRDELLSHSFFSKKSKKMKEKEKHESYENVSLLQDLFYPRKL